MSGSSEKNTDALTRFSLSRHRERPGVRDYAARIFTDVLELHGDRQFGDDPAMFTAIAKLDGIPVTVIGHVKGHTTQDNIASNFGMAHPEGYRKAMRQMKLAEKFRRPVITFSKVLFPQPLAPKIIFFEPAFISMFKSCKIVKGSPAPKNGLFRFVIFTIGLSKLFIS